MKKRNKAKRKAEARRRAQQPKPDVWPGNFHAARIAAPLPRTRGRPKMETHADPTPQTVERLPLDTLKELLRLGLISGQQMLAGENVLRAWRLRTPNDTRSKIGGFSNMDSPTSERLQMAYTRWCMVMDGARPPDELFRRCLVRPSKVVDWILDFSRCDTNEKGALGVLKAALDWWAEAERQASGGQAPNPRSPPKNRSKPTMRGWVQPAAA